MKIKQILESFVLKKDLSGLAKYIREHNTEIYQVYCEALPGAHPRVVRRSHWPRSPRDPPHQ